MNKERYHRQVLVQELGKKGQEKLYKKQVLIIGAGGLGSNSANILVRMGTGTIIIIDDDPLELSNIHRTTIFSEEDIGKPKSHVLEEKLKKTNSEIEIKGIKKRVTKHNIESFVTNTDLILDATDNLETRFLINDVAIKTRTPWVYAGVYSTMGMIMGVIPKQTPCLHCISQTIPQKKTEETPVIGNLPSTIASIQCTEAIKLLLDHPPSGLIIYDIWKQQFEHMRIQRNPECNCCCKEKYTFL